MRSRINYADCNDPFKIVSVACFGILKVGVDEVIPFMRQRSLIMVALQPDLVQL